MKLIATALVLGFAATPAVYAQGRVPMAEPQQAPAAPAAGATVVDTAGGTVGTIASIENGIAVIDTGTARISYPVTSMTPGPNGPIIALTKAALEASYAEQLAKAKADLKAKLVAGTTVRSVDGSAQLGTIKAADAEFVTLTTAKGDVRVPATAFSMDAQGVIIGMTAEQFTAATAGAR